MKTGIYKKSAFTLIELLVVISIIALLVSILMPALGKARKQARNVLCLNNLRQLSLTFTLYAHDYDGKFPYKPAGSLPLPHIWWEANQGGGVPDNRVFFDGYLDGFVLEELGVWTENVDFAPEVMYCPFTNSSQSTDFGFGRQWPNKQNAGWNPFGTNYSYFNLGKVVESGVWRSSAKMPLKMSTKGNSPMWGDVIEIKQTATPDIYDEAGVIRLANHFENGFMEFIPVAEETPKGLNMALMDGSVRFYEYDDCEVYWSYGTIQNVWGRPY